MSQQKMFRTQRDLILIGLILKAFLIRFLGLMTDELALSINLLDYRFSALYAHRYRLWSHQKIIVGIRRLKLIGSMGELRKFLCRSPQVKLIRFSRVEKFATHKGDFTTLIKDTQGYKM